MIDKRMINREKDLCWLKAMRRAIKEKTFKMMNYSLSLAAND
jgi:hypothetical protein